jgi:hypothetical protein
MSSSLKNIIFLSFSSRAQNEPKHEAADLNVHAFFLILLDATHAVDGIRCARTKTDCVKYGNYTKSDLHTNALLFLMLLGLHTNRINPNIFFLSFCWPDSTHNENRIQHK